MNPPTLHDISPLVSAAAPIFPGDEPYALRWTARLGPGCPVNLSAVTMSPHAGAHADAPLHYADGAASIDAVDLHAEKTGLGPSWGLLQKQWLVQMESVLNAATLVAPKDSAFISTGKRGVHSEHMGYILAEMQHLQRSYPGGAW